jgi:small-conductance mechanosensitive channel
MAYAASVYGFSQAVSLTILSHLLREAVLLQIQAIRLRKKYPEDFEYVPVANGVFKLTAVFASAVWLVVFADNINVLDKLQDWVSGALDQAHTVGSFTYSIGGILLFIFIIWVANFFQKYISYFFGDLGEDMEVENKEGRSRLLMTRLIVLIAGFLLAVAASGLPIDKITIILGALSVGIGLGLQNIVNNFVSGIILIFDRTLHIGDVVQISDQKGRVKEIGIRTSKLVTDDGAEIVIPNGDVVSHNIINWTLTNSNVRLNLTFTIEKPFNWEDVAVICREVLFDNKNVLTQKEPQVLRTTITPTSETVKVYFWCNSITATEATYSTVYPAIYSRFQAKGMKLL